MKIMNLEKHDYKFLAVQERENLINWLSKQFNYNEKAVIEITSDNYSSIVASLCVKAVGKENVIGVVFTEENDIITEEVEELLQHLNLNHIIRIPLTSTNIFFSSYLKGKNLKQNQDLIKKHIIRFKNMALSSLGDKYGRTVSSYTLSNLVLNTTAVELAINYNVCPVADFTDSEVIAIGKSLKLPEILLKEHRNIHFNYTNLDSIIREGFCNDAKEEALIWDLIPLGNNRNNRGINSCNSFLPNCVF